MEPDVTDLFQEPDDATPLDPALRAGLLQTWVTSRADLNEAEEANIVKGAAWARRRRNAKAADLLTDEFVKSLHKQMFGEVWDWAGSYRQHEVQPGIEPHLVPARMAELLDNVRFWIDNKTFAPDEIAARLHHGLTQIHPFPNGNGRHARLMADLLAERLGGEAFSWGGGSLQDVGTLRSEYVSALKAADQNDIEPLKTFMRA